MAACDAHVCAVLEWLHANKFFGALISLESESNVALERTVTGRTELDYFRRAVLRGQWTAVARIIDTLLSVHAHDAAIEEVVRRAQFETRRQAIFEMLADEHALQSTNGPDVDRLVAEVRNLEGRCSTAEYNELCFRLTATPAVRHSDAADEFNVARERYLLWQRLAASLQTVLAAPTDACEVQCAPGTLHSLLVCRDEQHAAEPLPRPPQSTSHRPVHVANVVASVEALPILNHRASTTFVRSSMPASMQFPRIGAHASTTRSLSPPRTPTRTPPPTPPRSTDTDSHIAGLLADMSIANTVEFRAQEEPVSARSPPAGSARLRSPPATFTPCPQSRVAASSTPVTSISRTAAVTMMPASAMRQSVVFPPLSPVGDDNERQATPAARVDLRCVGRLRDTAPVRCVDVSPCGRYIVAGGTSRALRLGVIDWPCLCDDSVSLGSDADIDGVSQGIAQNVRIAYERPAHHTGSIFCARFDASGELLATGSNDKVVKVVRIAQSLDADDVRHDVNTGRVATLDSSADVCLFGHTGTVRALAFRGGVVAPSAHLLSAGAGDYIVRLWDVGRAPAAAASVIDPVLALRGHTDCVYAVCVSIKGSLCVTGGADGVVRTWDLRAGGCAVDEIRTGSSVSSIALAGDDAFFVAGFCDGTVSHIDLRRAGAAVWSRRTHTDDCRALALRSGDCEVVSGSFDQHLAVSSAANGEVRVRQPCHAGKVVSVAVHDAWMLSGGSDHEVRVWRL